MCTGSKPKSDYTAQNKYSDMINWLDEDWQQRFKPLEESLINELENKDQNIRKNVDEAGIAAQKSHEATLGMANRNMARYGTELSADQQAAQERSQNLAGQGSQISSRNMARDATTARYDQLQRGMLNLGTGIRSGALSGMGSAANLESQRNQQNQQIYAQKKGNFWNTIGTAASIAAMYYTGGIASSKTRKKNIRPASSKKALKDVESVDLKSYDYKPGMSAGREERGHIGGMAEDMPASMVTSDRKGVDLGDTTMELIGATQELSNRVKRLEHRNG